MMSDDDLTTLISAACSILFMASFAVIFSLCKAILIVPFEQALLKGL